MRMRVMALYIVKKGRFVRFGYELASDARVNV